MSSVKNIKFIFIFMLLVLGLVLTSCSHSQHTSLSGGMGNMEKTTKEKQTSNNMISFELKKGEKLKVHYDSSVKEGSLKIEVEDPNHKAIKDIETNKDGIEEITIEADGKYAIFAKYEDFVGSFQVHVNK